MNSTHDDPDKPVNMSRCSRIVEELASDPLDALATLALYVGHRQIPAIDQFSSGIRHYKPLKKLKKELLAVMHHHHSAAGPCSTSSYKLEKLKKEDPEFIPKKMEQQTKKRKRKNYTVLKKKKVEEDVPTPDLPDVYREKIIDGMGGIDIKLVIQKELYPTDLKREEGRLSMPVKQVKDPAFLTRDETEMLRDNKEAEIAVKILDTKLKVITGMKLKRWGILKKDTGKGNPMYVLRTKWNDLVESNNLGSMVERHIQVWSFRVSGNLHLAIVLLDEVGKVAIVNQ